MIALGRGSITAFEADDVERLTRTRNFSLGHDTSGLRLSYSSILYASLKFTMKNSRATKIYTISIYLNYFHREMER